MKNGWEKRWSQQELKAPEKKALDWVRSPEGQKEIEDIIKKSEEMQNILREARRVNQSLFDPFTI